MKFFSGYLSCTYNERYVSDLINMQINLQRNIDNYNFYIRINTIKKEAARLKNKQKRKQLAIKWKDNHKEYERNRLIIWQKQGIYIDFFDEFKEMYNKANGKCEMCNKQLSLYPDEDLELAVLDHDHDTGLPRGILCSSCNSKLQIRIKPLQLKEIRMLLELNKSDGNK
jgi:hypothetical protein